MIHLAVFALLSVVPTPGEALNAMLQEHPFPAAQDSTLIEYGDRFLVPENPGLVKWAILRQFHRLAFQLPTESVELLAEYIYTNWDSLDAETRNLWREFAGRTGLEAPPGRISDETLTSILRYCSETGTLPPEVNSLELTALQRLYYVKTLPPDRVLEFMDDPCWAVRNAVIERNPETAVDMLQDSSPSVSMNAALASGRSDLLLEMSATPGPIGHLSLAGVGQVPVLEDTLYGSSDPAQRAAALMALLQLGWQIPEHTLDRLMADSYPLVGAIAAEASDHEFDMPPEGSIPEGVPALENVPDRIEIVTDAGIFTMDLLRQEAPVTCRSFWYLAETGFYDGIYFHRVIPGFVAQAGCPEGNGYGGPGYTIPAENNTVAYKRGVVGMADSGMNTGGSQFFVVLDSQRRLDCRYTVFAVVENTTDLDDIEVGTRILEIHRVNT